MESVNILENQLISLPKDSLNSTKNEEDYEIKDFQSVLEKQNTMNKSKIVFPKEIDKNVEINTKTIDEVKEEINEELISQINILLELLNIIELNNKEVSKEDLTETIIKLENLLSSLEELTSVNSETSLSKEQVELLDKMLVQFREMINENDIENTSIIDELENIIKNIEEEIISKDYTIIDNGKNLNEQNPIDIKESIDNQGYEEIDENINIANRDLNLKEIFISDNTEEADIVINNTSIMENKNQDATPNFNFIVKSTNDITNINNGVEFGSIQDFEREDLIQQIVEKIEFFKDVGRQEIRLKLKPDYLGELMLKMEEKNGIIQAKIFVENYRTKEIIESNLFQLKQQFEDNGLDIKTFEVYVGTNEDYETEKRNKYILNKKASKLKTKVKLEEELKIYDNSVNSTISKINYEGRLNLFV